MSILEVLVVACVVMVITAVLYPMLAPHGYRDPKSASAQNCRQIALAGLMYAGDYDDGLAPTIDGWLCRLQNRGDKQRTVNCPEPGTQDLIATEAAGGEPTRTWVHVIWPYLKSRGLFVDPNRGDSKNYFARDPAAVGDPGYDSATWTWRNQGRFPMYGFNYMFLSPLVIPKDKMGRPNPVNYAEARGVRTTEAADPSGTVFFTESQFNLGDSETGFFVVNAPGMWSKFGAKGQRYVAFWRGTPGSGDWTKTACIDCSCSTRIPWNGFVYTGKKDGSNVSFVDGHVKYMKTDALAAGTDYLTAKAGANGSGAVITDPKKYLWDLE